MREIIKDRSQKIKSTVSNFLATHKDSLEQVFLSAIVVFVALSSFELGRFSIKGSLGNDGSPATAKVSQTAGVGNYSKSTYTSSNSKPATGSLFVASKNGTKYFLTSCSGASRISSKNKIYFNSEAEAKSKGYSRAGNCSFN